MPVERSLLRETISYSEARQREVNILHQLGYLPRHNEFLDYIRSHCNLIETQVAYHLRVPVSECHVDDSNCWMHGSFNLCVPVTIEGFGRVIMRFPLRHRLGDNFRSGNSDEKIQCEAGTYAWMQKHCPTIRIPRLYGFGLSTEQCLTAVDRLPLFRRLFFHLRCWCTSLFGLPVPSQFVKEKQSPGADLGPYLLIDYIEEGEMLSCSWTDLRARKDLRQNLFGDLSRIMLAMSQIALPKIGSFTIDHNGYLQLANRPLTLMLHDLENEGIPVDMPRDQTFASVDSYANSLLSCHDNRLRFQPNAVNNASDCVSQMTALALMRTVYPQFFDRRLNHGPYVFCLTDLHPSNILVDEDWHIKCLIDLEWASSLPVEFMRPPIWLTGQAIDEIDKEDYNDLRKEFMDRFDEEEKNFPSEYNLQRTSILEGGWETGTFWYSTA